jgi:hypothetical protein
MARSRSSAARFAAAALLAVSLRDATAWPQSATEDTYPADITPPPGTQYHCALTPLPRSLPGIPEADRAYVNRTYTRVLRATQAKLLELKSLEDGRDIEAALARYQEATGRLVERLRAEPAPAGLAVFQEDVLAALALQQAFFVKAAPLRQAGRGMAEVFQLVEGRQASARLVSAWGRMQARYPSWSPETRDSIYHHLCALDFF